MNIVNPTLLLVAANMLFAGGGAYWALDTDPTWYPPKAKRPAKELLVAGKDTFSRKDIVELTQTLTRPLFSETRKPPPPPPPPPPSASLETAPIRDPLKDVRVIGLIEGEGGGAIIKVGKDVRRVSVGQAFEGWTLMQVSGFTVKFASGSSSRSLNMTFLPQPEPGEGQKDGLNVSVASPVSSGKLGRPSDPEKDRLSMEKYAARAAAIKQQFEASAGKKK
ncbi:MAG: hypothetical protein PHI64_02760 [Zoogloea sp.]|uniref:hypothetical protein n=1 Tax=Zoogloea sp. TaxID=49181 RepID=UPI0026130971|nr:hypothetical protein [Zoogloea sp.]MDD2987858.1 hypothetical protein [Zoogloea sp.]